jgi:gliding motility-associated protein GldC
MKKSHINFTVDLDDKNVPEKITWNATDKPDGEMAESKAITISLWDHEQKNTQRIDLWSKDMPVDDMKRFYIDCVGGLAQSALNATGDEVFNKELNDVCERLVQHLQDEQKAAPEQ